MIIKIDKIIWLVILYLYGVILRTYLFYNSNDFRSICNVVLILVECGFFIVDGVNNHKKRINKKAVILNVQVIILCISYMLSIMLTRNSFYDRSILVAARYCMTVLNAFFALEVAAKAGKLKQFLQLLLYLLIVHLILADILAVVIPGERTDARMYLLGNKFTMASLHLLALCIAQVLKKGKLAVVIGAVMAVVTIYLNVITGFIGGLVYFALQILSNRQKRLITEPVSVLSIGAVFAVLLFAAEWVLNTEPIKALISFFSKEGTIKSRMIIYSKLPEILSRRPIFGFGYGNMRQALDSVGIIANTQNGVLENVLQFGIVGTVLLFVLLVYALRLYQRETDSIAYPFAAAIVVKLIQASIEITLGMGFLVMLAMLSVVSIDSKKCADAGGYQINQQKKKRSRRRIRLEINRY